MNRNIKLLTIKAEVAAIVLFLFLPIWQNPAFLGLPDFNAMYRECMETQTNLQQEITNLKVENAQLRADLQGGRAVSEEQAALQKRAEELDRRERLLNQREDEIEDRTQDFNSTIRTTGEEVGQAKQLREVYEQNRELLQEVSISRATWRTLFWGTLTILVAGLLGTIPLFLYVRKLQFSKSSLERVLEMLRTKLQDPSADVQEVKTMLEISNQITGTDYAAKPDLPQIAGK